VQVSWDSAKDAELWKTLSNAAPISKQRFIWAYDRASRKALTKSNTRSGFHGAGVYPTNKDRAKEAIVQWYADRKEPTPPRTLQKAVDNSDIFLYTPQGQRDSESQVGPILQHIRAAQRGVRTLFRKAGDALDQKSSEIASLKRENEYLKDKN
jgi:hypothetical protein